MLIIVTDTREQQPFDLSDIGTRAPGTDIKFVSAPLPVGDYGIQIPNTVRYAPFFIERKSKSDLYGSLGSGREREEAKCARAQEAGYDYHMVIEADFAELATDPPAESSMSPFVITRTLFSWSVRYQMHVWAMPNRRLAAVATMRLLEFAYKRFVEHAADAGPEL